MSSIAFAGPNLGIDGSYRDIVVDNELIRPAVDSLIQTMAQSYLDLVSQFNKALEKSSDGKVHPHDTAYSIKNYGQKFSAFILSSDSDLRNSANGTVKYYATVKLDPTKLNTDTPLELLVDSIFKKLSANGVTATNVVLRFDKGYIQKALTNDLWHSDREPLKALVSFSSREGWSTRLIDNENFKAIFGDKSKLEAYNTLLKSTLEEKAKLYEQMDALSKPAELGVLYDGRDLFHRAPLEKDLVDIQEDDYRLFILFSTDPVY
jgi:hypothetical protein